MTTELIIICATVLVLAIITVIARQLEREQGSPARTDHGPAVGARVRVYKLDGQILQGEVVVRDQHQVVLEKVDVITDGESTPSGGRWYIDADRYEAIQEI